MCFGLFVYTAAGEGFAGKEASSCPAMSCIFIFDIIYRNGCRVPCYLSLFVYNPSPTIMHRKKYYDYLLRR